MTKKLPCLHCEHFVAAATWDAADRAMMAHYEQMHPDKKYAEPIDLEIDEAIRQGKLSLKSARYRAKPSEVMARWRREPLC
jgi:hypothetical protein